MIALLQRGGWLRDGIKISPVPETQMTTSVLMRLCTAAGKYNIGGGGGGGEGGFKVMFDVDNLSF